MKIARPIKMTELRTSRLDDSVTLAEVVRAVAAIGACKDEKVSTDVICYPLSHVNGIYMSPMPCVGS